MWLRSKVQLQLLLELHSASLKCASLDSNRDERPVESPARSARLDVDRRLRGNPIALLGDRGEHNRHRKPVFVARRTDMEGCFGHVQIVARG